MNKVIKQLIDQHQKTADDLQEIILAIHGAKSTMVVYKVECDDGTYVVTFRETNKLTADERDVLKLQSA